MLINLLKIKQTKSNQTFIIITIAQIIILDMYFIDTRKPCTWSIGQQIQWKAKKWNQSSEQMHQLFVKLIEDSFHLGSRLNLYHSLTPNRLYTFVFETDW